MFKPQNLGKLPFKKFLTIFWDQPQNCLRTEKIGRDQCEHETKLTFDSFFGHNF